MRLAGLLAVVLLMWASVADARPALRLLEPARMEVRLAFRACAAVHELPVGHYSIRLWIDDTGKTDLTELVIPAPISDRAYDCIEAATENVRFPTLPLDFMECVLPVQSPSLHVPWQTRRPKIEHHSPAPYGVVVPMSLAPRPSGSIPPTSGCGACTLRAEQSPRAHFAAWLLVAVLLFMRRAT
jgi:hypothetical protein